MGLSEATRERASIPGQTIDPKELEYIAFSGRKEIAHGMYRSIPAEKRFLYTNKYILSEVISGGIDKLRKFLAASAEGPARDEKAFIDETMDFFISSCRSRQIYPRELFQSVLNWSEELSRLSLLQEAVRYYDEALGLEVRKYPDLYNKALLAKATVLNTLGSFREAQTILLSLASRPYVITDRNLVPDVFFHLGRESLLKGDIVLYKDLLFRGLRHFYTRLENRRFFVDQIVLTYRRSIKVLIDPHISIPDKILFSIHRVYFLLQRIHLFNLLRVTGLMRIFLLGYVYCINYGFRTSFKETLGGENARQAALTRSERRNILITRAMGGIGDLLMMTPGLHALKEKHPHQEIHLAIPKRYFPLFSGNPDVTLLDIEGDQFDAMQYRRWFNFTDCPASRVESRSAPKVKKGRIEIFARSMGVGPIEVRRMGKQPRYFVLPEERSFQINFWKKHGLTGKRVFGIQLRSDEVYRDYPHMRELVARMARDNQLLVFDAEKIDGLESDHVIKVDSLPLRSAFALASACDAIIAPDSSFVHLAAAFDIPCVALYGPIDGHVRTMHYPKCKYVDVRKKLGCMPCWRNEQIPCKLTNMRASVCMADISIEEVLTALNEVRERKTL